MIDPELKFWAAPADKFARRWAWLGPAIITLLAAILRAWNLSSIKTLIFDETYYVKDAYALVHAGYEVSWPKNIDADFITGNFTLPTDPGFVVHPPVGRWMIAAGIKIFGSNPLGWRISAYIVGLGIIFLVGRIAWELFSSPFLATTAAAFTAMDGEQVALSRTAILDIFLTFWVVLGVFFLVKDQKIYRAKLLRALDVHDHKLSTIGISPTGSDEATAVATGAPSAVPGGFPDLARSVSQVVGSEKATDPKGLKKSKKIKNWWITLANPGVKRWYLVGTGVSWGFASAVKWSGFYVIAAFGIFVFLRELSARWKHLGSWLGGGIIKGGIPAFIALVPTALAIHLFSWSGWFANMNAWGHNSEHTSLAARFADWWEYQKQTMTFHLGVTSDHPYKSNPWGWLFQWRPTCFFFEEQSEELNCAGQRCLNAINSVGNPALWWIGIVAVFLLLYAGIKKQEWRANLILTGFVATWLPWLNYSERTIFTFYTVVISPFVVLGVTYLIGTMMGMVNMRKEPSWVTAGGLRPKPQFTGPYLDAIAVGLVVFILFIAVFFYPIWSGLTIARSHYYWRMWLPSWV